MAKLLKLTVFLGLFQISYSGACIYNPLDSLEVAPEVAQITNELNDNCTTFDLYQSVPMEAFDKVYLQEMAGEWLQLDGSIQDEDFQIQQKRLEILKPIADLLIANPNLKLKLTGLVDVNIKKSKEYEELLMLYKEEFAIANPILEEEGLKIFDISKPIDFFEQLAFYRAKKVEREILEIVGSYSDYPSDDIRKRVKKQLVLKGHLKGRNSKNMSQEDSKIEKNKSYHNIRTDLVFIASSGKISIRNGKMTICLDH